MPLSPVQQQYGGIDREMIWLALYQHLKMAVGSSFTTISRRHVMPPKLMPEQQPALFVIQMKERREAMEGLPTTLTLEGFLILYVPAPMSEDTLEDEQDLTATTFNRFFKAIDDAFVPDNPTRRTFTLGGLVQHCWIEGDVEQDPGIFTTQGAAIIPVKILVP